MVFAHRGSESLDILYFFYIEARNNLKEMVEVIEEDHKLEVLKRIWDKENEEYTQWYHDNKCGDTD